MSGNGHSPGLLPIFRFICENICDKHLYSKEGYQEEDKGMQA